MTNDSTKWLLTRSALTQNKGFPEKRQKIVCQLGVSIQAAAKDKQPAPQIFMQDPASITV
jgi:hypothetical protein